MTDGRKVCIVIPCFNEEHRLQRAAFLSFLDAHPWATLCFVDDGSTDRTAAVVEEMRRERAGRILLHVLSRNAGKAEAVRQGVLFAVSAGDWPFIGYFDADLSTPLAEVDRLLAVLEANPALWLALGARVKRLGSVIERRAVRHVLGRVFATFASIILRLPVYDSQCGAKLFRRELVERCFATPFMTRWLFDLEILARLRNAPGVDVTRVAYEVPLGQWVEVGGSKLRLGEMVGVPLELWRLHKRYNA